MLKFFRISDSAYEPLKVDSDCAGFDLRSSQTICAPARSPTLVLTDLQIEVPEGCYGRIAPRSGLALGKFIDIGGGVIDRSYRGNIGIIIHNHSDSVFKIYKGDRIAQLICEKIIQNPVLKEEKYSLNTTQCGASGTNLNISTTTGEVNVDESEEEN
jgi:dUTP pyrophosphatase